MEQKHLNSVQSLLRSAKLKRISAQITEIVTSTQIIAILVPLNSTLKFSLFVQLSCINLSRFIIMFDNVWNLC